MLFCFQSLLDGWSHDFILQGVQVGHSFTAMSSAKGNGSMIRKEEMGSRLYTSLKLVPVLFFELFTLLLDDLPRVQSFVDITHKVISRYRKAESSNASSPTRGSEMYTPSPYWKYRSQCHLAMMCELDEERRRSRNEMIIWSSSHPIFR